MKYLYIYFAVLVFTACGEEEPADPNGSRASIRIGDHYFNEIITGRSWYQLNDPDPGGTIQLVVEGRDGTAFFSAKLLYHGEGYFHHGGVQNNLAIQDLKIRHNASTYCTNSANSSSVSFSLEMTNVSDQWFQGEGQGSYDCILGRQNVEVSFALEHPN